MEKICPHCTKSFTVKRIDSVYCSRSCRQMAYIGRKTKADSIVVNINPVKAKDLPEDESLKIKLGLKGSKESAEIMPEGKMPSIDASGEKYPAYQSNFLNRLVDFTNERHHLSLLRICLEHEDLPSYCISLHFRCLVECLLIFSELKYVKVDDLMELCNAFTYIVRSRSYASLPKE